MKLRTLLIILALLMSSIIGGFSGLAYYAIGDLGSSLRATTENASKIAKLLDDTRAAQVAFQRQVQEWKDILIRGNEKDRYDTHLKGFNNQEKTMDETLNLLGPQLKDSGMDTSPVDTLLEAHATLGKKYREALATFNPDDAGTGKAVDLLVRGIDRPTSAALSDLATKIERESNMALSASAIKAKSRSEEALSTFFAIAGAAFVATLLLCFAIGRGVLRKVGGEPTDLAQAFATIAQGDFTQKITVAKGDQASIAASAAMMQMRVRSMVRAIHSGSEELEGAADKANITSTPDELKTIIREARRAVKGLSDAANRFKA